MHRRHFLRLASVAGLGPWVKRSFGGSGGESSDDEIRARIEAHRPTRTRSLPHDFNQRVGATHVAGKYHLTDKPFLIEGAEKLLELGTRLGKFWFTLDTIPRSYPFNSEWGRCRNFVELAKSDYFQRVFALPFDTILLEAHTPLENGWIRPGLADEFYAALSQEFYDLTAHLYRTFAERSLTFVLQHWEGDWLLRGRGGELWDPPPNDWRERCERMVKWLAARQAGVSKARAEFAGRSKCTVAHAAEVNRVADAWKSIPTMTRHVLPHLDLDLVSYSCYDGMRDPLTLWRCLAEIRKFGRPTALFRDRFLYVGEIGIPENEQPAGLAERWDQWMGVCLAADVRYVVHWQLYCNEFSPKLAANPPQLPVKDPAAVRGFWLVKSDGSLSESGRYFSGLWSRGRAAVRAFR